MSIESGNLKKFDVNQNGLIEVLNKAISKIKDNEYVKIDYGRVERGSQKPERVFVAELYHQLRCIQESNKHSILKDLKFNVEINKQGDLITGVKFIDNYKIKRVVPDLILHYHQNNTNSKMQQLVCEVKSSYCITKVNFEKDLVKLLLYKKSRLKYQNACFIFLGTKKELFNYLMMVYDELIQLIKENEVIFITHDKNKWNFYEYK